MAASSDRGLPSGHDEKFVSEVEDDFHCLICHLPLKEPVQTRCGHRFCKECLEEHLRRQEAQAQPYTCPADREGLDRDRDVFPDKATERKILSLAIMCSNDDCDWTGELRNKMVHLASCPFQDVLCTNENCHVTLKRKDLDEHVNSTCEWSIIQCKYCRKPHLGCHMQAHIEDCDKFPEPCPNKCGDLIPRETIQNHIEEDCKLTSISCPYEQMGCDIKFQRLHMESHLQSAMGLHLDLTCVKMNSTQVELKNAQERIRKLEHVELKDARERIRKLEHVELKDARERIRKLEQVELKNARERIRKLEHVELKDARERIRKLEQVELKNAQERIRKLEHVELKDARERIRKLEQVELKNARERIRKLEQVELKDARERIRKLEEKLHTWKMVWKIDKFSTKRVEGEWGAKTYIESDSFYTETPGYKRKVLLYPNGDESGGNTHLSVYIIIMQGQYDAILTWPFDNGKETVKCTLIDQEKNPLKRENFVVTGHKAEFVFTVPQEEKEGYGWEKFISHQKLLERRYVVNDTLFLQVEIYPSP